MNDRIVHLNHFEVILLGRRGEHQATRVVIDLTPFVDRYGEGSAELVRQGPNDTEAHPVPTEQIDNMLYWVVTSDDTKVDGNGQLELRYYVSNGLAKSLTWSTKVEPSLFAGDDPPVPASDWFDKLAILKEQLLEWFNKAKEFVADLKEKLERGELDGFSPIAQVRREHKRAVITITDREGTTTADVYDGVPGEDCVGSINGVKPDSTGAVTLTAGDLGAYTTEQTDGKIQDLNQYVTREFSEVDAALEQRERIVNKASTITGSNVDESHYPSTRAMADYVTSQVPTVEEKQAWNAKVDTQTFEETKQTLHSEIDAARAAIPTKLSELAGDATHRTVTDEQIVAWDTSGNEATEAAAGVVAIATQNDVAAGTNDTKAITPKKLAAVYRDSDAQDVIDQALSDRIDRMETGVFPNATFVGEPLVVGSNVSRFTNADYMIFPFVVDVRGKAFSIDFAFRTGANVATQQNILDSRFGLALAIRDGKGLMAMSSNGTSWDIGQSIGTYTIAPNSVYYARLAWDGTKYTTSLSADGTEYVVDMTLNSSLGLYPETIYIGGAPDLFGVGTSHPFSGGIDMSDAKLIVSGIEVWKGMDTPGLATRANVSLSNLDAVGESRFTKIEEDLETKTKELGMISDKLNAEVEQLKETYGKQMTDTKLPRATSNAGYKIGEDGSKTADSRYGVAKYRVSGGSDIGVRCVDIDAGIALQFTSTSDPVKLDDARNLGIIIGASKEVVTVPVGTTWVMLTVPNGDTTTGLYAVSESVADKVERIETELPKKVSVINHLSGKKIGILGDSISAGLGSMIGSQGQIISGTTLAKPWHSWVAERYGGVVHSNISRTGSGFRLDNSGADTRFTKRIESIAKDCDVIFVFGGTNDSNEDATIGSITDSASNANGASLYAAVKYCMEYLQNNYAGKQIVFITPLQRVDVNTHVLRDNYKKTRVIKDCSSIYGIPVVDLGSASQFSTINEEFRIAFCPDGTHPNDAGTEIYVKNGLFPTLDTIFLSTEL